MEDQDGRPPKAMMVHREVKLPEVPAADQLTSFRAQIIAEIWEAIAKVEDVRHDIQTSPNRHPQGREVLVALQTAVEHLVRASMILIPRSAGGSLLIG